MRTKMALLIVLTSPLAIVLQVGTRAARAQGQTLAALSGKITSQEEGAMEGVVVSAKKDGSTITVSVISDKQGHFAFPASRLDTGHYVLAIRAVGYDLDGPGSAEVAAHKTTSVDLKLRKTKDLASQLTNAEWLMSIPGTDEQKTSFLLGNCINCHTLERPIRSTHTADEFVEVISRMKGYSQTSQPMKPQRSPDSEIARSVHPEDYRKLANYLATVNLSSTSNWEYSFKTLPRPTGRSTHVIITEYDLPRKTIMPHDVIVDEHGTVWYSDFGEQYFGKLDPKTGKVTEWPVPRPKPTFPEGMLDVEEARDGTMWLGMMSQAGLARFDPKTETFRIYSAPDVMNDDGTPKSGVRQREVTLQYTVDGKVWSTEDNGEIARFDVNTGAYERFEPLKQTSFTPYGIYGIAADSHNNLYFAEISHGHIGRIDAKTKQVSFYPIPTPNSRPRRIEMDSQDRLWFAEYGNNRVGLFDTKTEKFAEWVMPTPWTWPYYVTRDKNGELWTGGMNTDRVVRLDPQTGEIVEYLMPKDTNIRRVFVDNRTTPVTFWTGSNHGAAVVKVEPLD
ncbi:MAG: carboxypeptidase regulatory-like domain-containing protein [Candidatus Acidiferrales bacterium]